LQLLCANFIIAPVSFVSGYLCHEFVTLLAKNTVIVTVFLTIRLKFIYSILVTKLLFMSQLTIITLETRLTRWSLGDAI